MSFDSSPSNLSQRISSEEVSEKGVFFNIKMACVCSVVEPRRTIECAIGSVEYQLRLASMQETDRSSKLSEV